MKQLWLLKGNKLSEDGETQLPGKGKHDLPAIADDVGVQLSSGEREALKRLSLFVSSYGRYPVTKKWSNNPLTQNEHGVKSRLNWSKEDHQITEDLIQKLTLQAKALTDQS